MSRSHLVPLGALLTLIVTGLPAAAEEKFPSRPITLINPYPPGGSSDAHFRVIAAQAEKVFGVPVVIDTKPGAAATLGPATMTATAKPDGYTISNLPTALFSLPWLQKVAFDPARDFTYIIHLSGVRQQIIVRADAPWQGWKDLVADAKANPGRISYGSTGSGATTHMTIEALGQAAGIKLLHVPFRGSGEVLTALLGDHIKLGSSGGPARPLIESGKLRAILGVAPQRNPKSPGVPSLADEGLSIPVDLSFPYGIGGPKGMDPTVVKVLHDGFRRVLTTPEYIAVLDQFDLQDHYLDSESYRRFALQQIESHRALIESIGMARFN
jgi:tripartite-type tricarboxylate transporter receptor subunit TctC